jgi:Uncharacterized conserved protein
MVISKPSQRHLFFKSKLVFCWLMLNFVFILFDVMTNAIRFLKEHNVEFEVFTYDYQPKGGARQTAEELNVPLHNVVKTLVFCAPELDPFLVLMHGDLEVSEKELARIIGVKEVQPCDQKTAKKWTGYVFGGTSPFGVLRKMKVYIQNSIFELDEIYINGGKQGLIVKIKPEVMKLLNYVSVDVKRR